MAAIGGSIESITLDGQIFSVAADADSQRKLGGYENEVQANGDGTARMVKTRTPWMLDGITVAVDDVRGDNEFLQSLADRNEYFPVIITYAGGATFTGNGMITGELQVSSQNATAAFTLHGQKALTQLN